MKPGKTITVIVVSRGLDALLRLCLEHIVRSLEVAGFQDSKASVAVMDNASAFSYGEDITELAEVVRLDTHHAFSTACNKGAELFPASYYLFVNNDVFLHAETIDNMLSVIDSCDRAAVCGARLVYPDGTIQHNGVVFGPGEKGPYHENCGLASSVLPRIEGACQAVTGACMLVKRQAFEQADGFDESYAFGLEDIDLCLRLRQSGWLIYCARAVDSLHLEATTPGRTEMDIPSRELFMKRWKHRYTIDGRDNYGT
jgi:GT2 family glycosyltransferase